MTSPRRELDTDYGARVVKSVDTRDLKSLDVRVVPVRFRPRAPLKSKSYERPLEIVAFLFCLNGDKVATETFRV